MKKYLIIIGSVIFIALVISGLIYFKKDSTDSTEPSVTINNHTFIVEIADEPSERSQGLSGREALCADCGMLFVFEDKAVRRFWMKNMNFPLDIIWIDFDNNTKRGIIKNINRNLAPEGQSPKNIYSSQYPVNYVLEINAGLTDKHNFNNNDWVEIKL